MGAMNCTWNDFFLSLRGKTYWDELQKKIYDAYSHGVCYPPQEKMYAAFYLNGQSEFDIMLTLCRIDGHHDERVALDVGRCLDSGIGCSARNA